MRERVFKAKAICKEAGIVGFKKMRLKRPTYYAGRQGQRIEPDTAMEVIEKLEAVGIRVSDTDRELATKGLLDTFRVS